MNPLMEIIENFKITNVKNSHAIECHLKKEIYLY